MTLAHHVDRIPDRHAHGPGVPAGVTFERGELAEQVADFVLVEREQDPPPLAARPAPRSRQACRAGQGCAPRAIRCASSMSSISA